MSMETFSKKNYLRKKKHQPISNQWLQAFWLKITTSFSKCKTNSKNPFFLVLISSILAMEKVTTIPVWFKLQMKIVFLLSMCWAEKLKGNKFMSLLGKLWKTKGKLKFSMPLKMMSNGCMRTFASVKKMLMLSILQKYLQLVLKKTYGFKFHSRICVQNI